MQTAKSILCMKCFDSEDVNPSLLYLAGLEEEAHNAVWKRLAGFAAAHRSCLVLDFITYSHCNGHCNLLHMFVSTHLGIGYRETLLPRNPPPISSSSSRSVLRLHRASAAIGTCGEARRTSHHPLTRSSPVVVGGRICAGIHHGRGPRGRQS
jgi:hypothetical protein